MNQKYQLNLIKKKGYLEIDFIFAVLLFFIFFISIYSYYINYIDSQHLSFQDSILIANSKDLCKILILTPGIPNDWENDLIKLKTLGLLKIGENNIDINKLSKFTNTNYFKLLNNSNILNLLNLQIIGLETNVSYLNFGFDPENYSYYSNSKYECYSNYNKETVKVIVGVWE